VGVKQINKVLRDNGISLAHIIDLKREKIVEEFNSGIDVWALAKKYKMTPAGIWKVLRDFGIRCSDKNDRNSQIFQRYSEGCPLSELETTFNLSESRLSVILGSPKAISKRSNSKTEYLDFEPLKLIIPSSTLFYWLGFIQADGNVSIKRKDNIGFSISLSIVDKEHLCKLATWLGFPDSRVRHKKCETGDLVSLSFSTPQLFAWYTYGIVPRKTYNYVKPNIPNEYFGDYLRGLIDGDGHTYVEGGKTHIEIVSNAEYSKWLIQELKQRGIHSKETSYEGKVYSRVKVFGLSEVRKIEALCNAQSTDLKLHRKWDKLANIQPIRERCTKHDQESRNTAIIKDYKAGLTRKQLMDKYNRSRPIICEILKETYQEEIQQRNREVHRLRQQGLTLQQIADCVGLTKQGVRSVLNTKSSLVLQ
jgi:Mor family transcriptional regulator